MTFCADCKNNNKCKIKKLCEHDKYFDNHGNCRCFSIKGNRTSTKKKQRKCKSIIINKR